MIIRPATPLDSPAAIEVIRSVYEEYDFTWDEHDYHADLYDLKGYYLDSGHAFWIAEKEDGKPVGTAALEVFDRIPSVPGKVVEIEGMKRLSGCDCALNRLYVLASERGQGIGAALFRTVIEEAKRRGRKQMEIWSDKRFTDAHRLYKRFGAEMIADRICDDPDVSPEWGLVLVLWQ